MKRLILTSSRGSGLMRSGLAELIVCFNFRMVWGRLPSPEYFASYLDACTDAHGDHWSICACRWDKAPLATRRRRHLGLIEFCEAYDAVELWFDSSPNDQLQQIWLLDFLRSFPEITPKLQLRIVDSNEIFIHPDDLEDSDVTTGDVTTDELETASTAWQAYRSKTPERCFDLLRRNLTALPLLKPALIDLLDELPSRATGLGATEMRLLEMLGSGYSNPNSLFYLSEVRQRRVFNDHEVGYLLEGLAHCPTPVITGLDDELRSLDRENYAGRHAAFVGSDLSLTELGKAVLVHEEDFSRHNPIDRWWGGTRLTNDRLWRFDPVLTTP